MFEQIDFQNYESIFSKSNYPSIDETNIAIDMSGPCLCLSGKSFKDCCNIDIQISLEFKESYPTQSNIILNDFYDINKFYQNLSKAPKTKSVDIENESRFYNHKIKYCSLFEIDGNNCDNFIKEAHTMSEGKVFKNLSNKKPVITFNEHAPLSLISLKNISMYYIKQSAKRKASKYPIFCNNHDDWLFKEIEKSTQSFANTYLEHLEYAIKACSYDVYYKVLNLRFLSEIISKEPLVFDINYLLRYSRDIEYLFKFKQFLDRLLKCHLHFTKFKKILDKNFRFYCIEIPSHKVEFSLSEIIPDEENSVLYFVNVINFPTPMILVSYFDKVGVKQKTWDDFIDMIFVNSTNIFFTEKCYNSLTDHEKLLLYLKRKNVSQSENCFYKYLSDFQDEIQNMIFNKICNVD